MPTERDDITLARDRAWYGDPTRRFTCSSCGSDVRQQAHIAFNMGHGHGVRWGIRRTTQLSPHIAKFVELITYLYYGEEDRLRNVYSELYLAARDVWGSHGSDTNKLERLGAALANISNLVENAENDNSPD